MVVVKLGIARHTGEGQPMMIYGSKVKKEHYNAQHSKTRHTNPIPASERIAGSSLAANCPRSIWKHNVGGDPTILR